LPTEVIVGLFTLAGVALGFAGQWLMERQRTHRTRVGMVKAMLGELRHNASVLVDARYVGPTRPLSTFSTDTWDAARFELAQFVPDQLFEDLLFIYEDMLPRVQSRLDEWCKAWPDKGVDNLLSKLEESIKRSMKDLLSLPQATSFRDRWQIRLRGEDSSPRARGG
jgi:hypothetical protein